MLSLFDILIVTLFVCLGAALLAVDKLKSEQSLLSRCMMGWRSSIGAHLHSQFNATDYKLVDGKRTGRVDNDDGLSEMSAHKDMYHKLHNLEDFPHTLPRARDQLIGFFAETLATASKARPTESILKLHTYSREALTTFMQDRDEQVNQQWEDYNRRRKAGGPLELFKDKEEARWWLKQIAPVKYVDGAWLGYVNKITLPFALRPVIKNSWQVLSEELGDGDLDKNHAHVYRQLVKSSEIDLPAGDTADFIDPRQEMNEPAVWKAALAQLLISLMPHEFFPEILGFNMHFEALALDTLKASREVKEIGLDSYYFLLHVSIDNADSGHTAIAQQAVCIYMEHIQQTEGTAAAEQAWRRVQVGYNLSDSLPGKATCPSMRKPPVDSFPQNDLENELIKIIKAKALVAHKIHSHCEIKIRNRRLVDWLDPTELDSTQWQMQFLDGFSRSKPWVYKGDSSRSRFVKELSWGGRMFGAFTQTETDVVKRWIDTMPSSHPQLYWDFTGREDDLTSPTGSRIDLSYNRPNDQSLKALESLSNAPSSSKNQLPESPFEFNFGINDDPDVAKFLPLWFSHPCLLETFISVPWKTTSLFTCSIVKILRAQAGFDNESGVVAGMDEANKTESLGLVEIGQELVRHWGYPEVKSLKEVLEKWESQPATTIAHLAMRPHTNKALLIGMAMAFASLHREMASSDILGLASKEALSDIARREKGNLGDCLKGLDDSELGHCNQGYWFAAGELNGCFKESSR